MIKFPSINQYRHVIQEVTQRAQFVGKRDDGSPIYDPSAKLPTLTVAGTVKLHGTNAAVRYVDGDLVCQSRNNIITPEKDNQGFARYVHENRKAFEHVLDQATGRLGPDAIAYGEWCGKGINGGCAIHELDKMFVIFAIRTGSEEEAVWHDIRLHVDIAEPEARVFNIAQFGTFLEGIDFEDPAAMQNKLVELTLAVEEECPVGKHFGVSGVGEGIVWRVLDPGYNESRFWFKVKGEKHSETKVKKLAEVDMELVSSIKEFLDNTVTEERLQHVLAQLKESGAEMSQKSTGLFIKATMGDVMKEERDRLEASGLKPAQVQKDLGRRARDWFFAQLNAEVGL